MFHVATVVGVPIPIKSVCFLLILSGMLSGSFKKVKIQKVLKLVNFIELCIIAIPAETLREIW